VSQTLTLSPELIRVAWETGQIGYRLRNIQKKIRKEWLDAQSIGQKFYIECTRRLGKSTFLLLLLSEFCIKHPGSKAGFYAPVKEGLRDYIIPLIEKAFSDCPDELRPILDSHLTLDFPNGSTIIFRGSNNQTHRIRRGNDLQIAAIDEARDVDDLDNLIDSVVIPSLFTTSGRLLISSTPADTEDHPLFTIKQQAERGGWLSHYTIYDASRYDPTEFPLHRIEQWKKETSDQVAWEREYMAKWVKDPTKIIIPEWSDSFVQTVPHDHYFPYYHKYAALDSGVRDKTAVILGYYDFLRATLIIEDEFALQGADVLSSNIAEMLKEREVQLGYQLIHDRKDERYGNLEMHQKVKGRVADNNNLVLINDLNARDNLDFFPTRKDELPAMINLCREWIKDGRILIDKRCKELLGCVRNAIWDKNKRELARSKLYGHFDALMALVYLVRNVDVSTNPIPQHFGKSFATHAIPHTLNIPRKYPAQLLQSFKVKNGTDRAREGFIRGGS
jgi:hypothetical protein